MPKTKTIIYKELTERGQILLVVAILFLSLSWLVDNATLSAFGLLSGLLFFIKNSIWEITEDK